MRVEPMNLSDFHPEDIKAAIRKRYRSFGRFERAECLGKNSVADVLRGRPSRRTEEAILRVIAEEMKVRVGLSIVPASSTGDDVSHRLNAGAK